MLTEIQGLRDKLRTCVVGLDTDRIDGVSARNLVVVFAEMERIAAAGKMLAISSVAHPTQTTTTRLVADANGPACGPLICDVVASGDSR